MLLLTRCIKVFLRVSTGMLRRWDDSQRFLSEQPLLICEETANYLILWCFRLQQEGVRR